MRTACFAGLALLGLLLGLTLTMGWANEAIPQAGATKTNPKDGAPMVWVPAGPFAMGLSADDIATLTKERSTWKAEWFADETPRHTVTLDGYWMYKYEVTVGQYRKFCKDTDRPMPGLPFWAKDDFPIVNVTWFDATNYAEWAGARLPTEAEWEKAARGTDGRRFPWGNTWDTEKCNNFSDHNPAGNGFQAVRAAPGGSYPTGMSPYGVHDLAGNVWEWCQDRYDRTYYARAPSTNPTGPETGEFRVLRGGSWGSSSVSIRSAGRHADSPDATYHDDGGFRCVMSPPKRDK